MEKHHFEEEFSGKGKLNLVVEVGQVEVFTHERDSVVVNGRTQHMTLTVTRQDNTITVRADVEDDWQHIPGKLLNFLKGEHPRTELTIHIPAHCEVNAKVITGSLELSGVMAPITTHVITGKTKLTDLGGPIYAKSVTGFLSYNGYLSEENHRFETTTGDLQLRLTKEPNAHMDMKTVTGRVHCGFALTNERQQSHMVGRKITGTLGAGTGHIKARVVTGNLSVAHA
jgi:hypothetical protein